jgi:hypothetical protein
MNWLVFLRAVMPDLLALARELYADHHGDAPSAKYAIKLIRDRRADVARNREAIDAELAQLRREGK